MPAKPTFEPGFWNAWLLMLFMIQHPFIMVLVDKSIGTGDLNRKMGDVADKEGKKQGIPIPSLLLVLLFIVSIFLPLKLGTAWFLIGLLVYLAGLMMFLDAIIVAARTPAGLVFKQGIYRYSRHPLYLAFLIVFVGISLAAASWFFLLLSLGWMIFPLSQVTAEERGCLETFGDEYQEYMRQTPRWLGLPYRN